MENRENQASTGPPPQNHDSPPLQAGESKWILHAISGLENTMAEVKQELKDEMDVLKKRSGRIEKMLWMILGATGLVTFLFGQEILAFVRNHLAG